MGAFGFGPSLALRPGGVRRAAAAAVVPGLPVFDFTAGTLPAGVVLTRASAATFVDAGGALATAAADVARFARDPSGAVLGLMVEGATANLLAASDGFEGTSWSRTGLTVPSPGVLVEGSGGSNHVLRPATAVAFAAGVTYCVSVEVAELAGSAKRWVCLRPTQSTTTGAFGPSSGAILAKFDAGTGAVFVQGTAAGQPIACGARAGAGGRWRVWVAATAATSINDGPEVRPAAAGGTALIHAGDGTSGVSLARMQLEKVASLAAGPSSAIPAGGRAADVVTLDWGSRGVADGPVTVRVTADDGSTQDVATTVLNGRATLPPLARAVVRRAALA